ncbi:sce7726 family protein [Exiguobacterium sp. SRB7LM]|uniref:sce7726 family protein n=1 Tax=Exiguobacterium sp. SRB7LM TaxID=2608401 RepID=UPI0018C420F5|nr:sce7726 family protein [Exiguobacterium sp. SRB7LM]MBG0916404.1 sce7726 family protein [Exiguobacterium sp. SRB7LM]
MKDEKFELAQQLSSKYYTLLSEVNINETVIDVFQDKLHLYNEDKYSTYREFVNNFLLSNYPNEVSIKSTFLNNVLFKEHNHVSIFELNVGKSRLDLCKLGRFSTAFEIKTELDTPKRLKQQLDDYFKVFEYVFVICSVNNVDSILPYLPESCGIYTYHTTLSKRYIFKKTKKAIKSDKIQSYDQLSILTKLDLINYFDCFYSESKEEMINFVINSHSSQKINIKFKLCIKNKYESKWRFLSENRSEIFEIDYQWFFKNTLSPKVVYL